MPAIESDGSAFANEGAIAEEQAKVEQAKAELMDENPEVTGYLGGKYQSVEDLENGYKALQSEYTRLREEQAGEAEAAGDEESIPDNQTPQFTVEDVDQLRGKMFDQVGGEAKYAALAQWANQNLSPDRQAAYDEALASFDEGRIMNALKGIQFDHLQANGYEPKLTGGSAPAMDVRGFKSEAQVVEAMNDPRYSGPNADPAYIREVESKLAVSPSVFSAR